MSLRRPYQVIKQSLSQSTIHLWPHEPANLSQHVAPLEPVNKIGGIGRMDGAVLSVHERHRLVAAVALQCLDLLALPEDDGVADRALDDGVDLQAAPDGRPDGELVEGVGPRGWRGLVQAGGAPPGVLLDIALAWGLAGRRHELRGHNDVVGGVLGDVGCRDQDDDLDLLFLHGGGVSGLELEDLAEGAAVALDDQSVLSGPAGDRVLLDFDMLVARKKRVGKGLVGDEGNGGTDMVGVLAGVGCHCHPP